MTMNQLFSVILLWGMASMPAQADRDEVITKVMALNEASVEWLGISLAALGFLSELAPGTHIPLSYLEETGKLQLVEMLEVGGYVKSVQVLGLPDAQDPGETFLKIWPTDEGMVIQASVLSQTEVRYSD